MKPETKKAFVLFVAALGLGSMALVDLLLMPSSWVFYYLTFALFLFLRGLERLLTDSDPVAARMVGRSALVCFGGGMLLALLSSLFVLSGHAWFLAAIRDTILGQSLSAELLVDALLLPAHPYLRQEAAWAFEQAGRGIIFIDYLPLMQDQDQVTGADKTNSGWL